MKGFPGADVLSLLWSYVAPQAQEAKEASAILNSPELGFFLDRGGLRIKKIAIMATFMALTEQERSRFGALTCLDTEQKVVGGRLVEEVTLFGKLSDPDEYFDVCYQGSIKDEGGAREPQSVVFTGHDCRRKTATFSDVMIRVMNERLQRSP